MRVLVQLLLPHFLLHQQLQYLVELTSRLIRQCAPSHDHLLIVPLSFHSSFCIIIGTFTSILVPLPGIDIIFTLPPISDALSLILLIPYEPLLMLSTSKPFPLSIIFRKTT